MINYTYQLVSPQVFSIKYDDVEIKDEVIIRPTYLSICHADQRYYQGKRSADVLKKKLPMALIHECCGHVEYDPTGTFCQGELVVPIPNIPKSRETGIYENYVKGSKFLSSGYDGFMREYISMPAERVVSLEGVKEPVAAVSEFISVAIHAVTRFEKKSHESRGIIGIWGDGSLAYCVSAVLKRTFPETKVIVIGKSVRKLAYFSFVDQTYLVDKIPEDMKIDHAFECCGGEGSSYAIDDIIRYCNPQGTVMLMGVSENKVSINTRDVLEKGLSLIGCSRSGRTEFLKAAEYMKEFQFQKRIEKIIQVEKTVSDIDGIHQVFQADLQNAFKTVFQWK